jgi:hypothetical protein
VTAELPVYGAKVLACRECILDLHGRPTVRSWTRLAATSNGGETALLLLEPVDWDVGSEIVVASSSDEMHDAEVCVLAALELGGTRLVLTSPLAHEHLGVSFEIGGHTIEMRAEVGLLSRNTLHGTPSITPLLPCMAGGAALAQRRCARRCHLDRIAGGFLSTHRHSP